MKLKYNPEGEIEYNGLTIQVSSTVYEGEKIYRLEWPDHTIDLLLDGDNERDWETIMPEEQKKELRQLLNAKLN
jgi:hypothetical protein